MRAAEEKARAAMADEMERLKREIEEGGGSEEARRRRASLENREAELLEIIKEKDREIARLKAELEKLQAAFNEMQMQLEAMLNDPSGARDKALAMKKRLGEQLNWGQGKRTHENVFDRLYHDALDRLTRMEVLRQTFMKMQREQLVLFFLRLVVFRFKIVSMSMKL